MSASSGEHASLGGWHLLPLLKGAMSKVRTISDLAGNAMLCRATEDQSRVLASTHPLPAVGAFAILGGVYLGMV